MILYVAITGWCLAAVFYALWLRAVRDWDKADNEATYLAWKERMRVRALKGNGEE